jgi:hypothetical protein
VRFFLDNCLSPRYAQGLNALSEKDSHKVIHLQNKFPRDAKDPEWIRGLGAESDWIIVSGDTRIIKSQGLRKEWQAARLTAFFLASGWMNVPYWTQVTLLVRWWPKILDQSSLVRRGSGFEVPYRAPGTFKPVITRP